MERKPLLLDLFCGAGGASRGYHTAGFDVVGVDIAPQPHYPYMFEQYDALEYLKRYWFLYDAIHASPPCQAFTPASNGSKRSYEDILTPTIRLMETINIPWVIENVPEAPMNATIMLCGQMFGLGVYRHRIFYSNVELAQPTHPIHRYYAGSSYGRLRKPRIITVAGHLASTRDASRAMGINWMGRYELTQAIPPAYTEYVGCHIIKITA